MKGVKDLNQYRKDHKALSPKRAIKAFCADCMGEFIDGIKDCNNPKCPLYPHQPYNKHKKEDDIEDDSEDDSED